MNGSQTGLLRAVQLSPAGWPASSSTGSASWCCRTISTSPVSLWRSLDERQAALHRYDQSPAVVERRRQETAQRELRNQQKSWSKDGYNNARGSFVDDAPARNYRDHSYANDESQGAPFLQRKLRRNHRNRPQALGVFSDVQAIPDGEETHALHFKERRDVLTESTRSTASQKERDELKAKIKQSMDAVASLPPLTDQDFQDIYQDLLSYDSEPIQPSSQQKRLGSATDTSDNSSNEMQSEARKSIRHRLEEVLLRLEGQTSRASSSIKLEQQDDHVMPTITKPGDRRVKVSSGRHRSSYATQSEMRQRIQRILNDALRTDASGLTPEQGSYSTSLTPQEWAAVTLSAANEGDVSSCQQILDLMQRAKVIVSDELLVAVTRLLSRYPASIPPFLTHLQINHPSIPSVVHHEVVAGMVRGRPDNKVTVRAEQYLRALEESQTPALPDTYAIVLKTLFHIRHLSPSARARAWNLFGHARLVAHPVPSAEMYNAMIYGCALDDVSAPERALDLFTEMVTENGVSPTYETYAALVRVCARSRNDTFFFEALRLLQELLDRNFRPAKDIFNSVLEGTRSRGDLPRAKWLVRSMMSLASEGRLDSSPTPDATIFANLLLTYATFKPIAPDIAKAKDGLDPQQPADVSTIEAQPDVSGDVKSHDLQSSNDGIARHPVSTVELQGEMPTFSEPSATETTADILAQIMASGNPTSREQVIKQVKALMHCILYPWHSATHAEAGSATSESPSINDDAEQALEKTDSMRSAAHGILPTPLLLNAYLSVLLAHSDVDSTVSAFSTLFDQFNVPYSHESWEIVLNALDKPTSGKGTLRGSKAETAEKLFDKWQTWLREEKASRPPGQVIQWVNRHTELIWARMISIVARARNLERGVQLVNDFCSRFRPDDIVMHASAAVEQSSTSPGYLIQMSSHLYPETSIAFANSTSTAVPLVHRRLPPAPTKPLPKTSCTTRQGGPMDSPPALLFSHVYPLFARLREEEENGKAESIIDRLAEYAKAMRRANEIRSRRECQIQQTARKEARKNLLTMPVVQRQEVGKSRPKLDYSASANLPLHVDGISSELHA